MSPVFDKLNLKHERDILVVNAPSTLEPELAGWNTIRSSGRVHQLARERCFVHGRSKSRENN